MARTHRQIPPNAGGKVEKIKQAKRENHQLRRVNKTLRRDLKNMRGILLSVRHALNKGDILRAVALIPDKIKQPPNELTQCQHMPEYKYVRICSICREVDPL